MKRLFKKAEIPFLFLILFTGSFLRLYKLCDWQYFSYDQARDYLIVKRIIVDRKFTLIGPSLALADGVYLPPFYYYCLVPFLWLSKFHIWGPDFLSALIGLAGVGFFYLLANPMFGKKSAFLASLFYVFNPFMILAARHSRNPHWLPLFMLLFAAFAKKYLNENNKKDLWLASLYFGICLSLHITTIVYLPIYLYLVFRELKKKSHFEALISLLIIFLFFTPLFVFELRHNFGISKALFIFLKKDSDFSEKTGRFFILFPKILLVLFSGNFQKELGSLRSLPILSLEEISFTKLDLVAILKFFAALAILLSIIFSIIYGVKNKKTKNEIKFILSFVVCGFSVSFLTSKNYSFFYYFYSLFPFLFLLLAWAIFVSFGVLEKKLKIFTYLFWIFLALVQFFPNGLKTETRSQGYFLPAVEVIAQDLSLKQNFNIVANIKETGRWEKNGMEYRYFLEAIFKKRPLGDSQESYQKTDVLYLIDEGNLKEPLKLGGMEMEAFGPKKISRIWKVSTGQKVYKLDK